MKPSLILVGAGGHAQVVAEAASEQGIFDIAGLLDSDSSRWGQKVLQWPVLGGDEYFVENPESGIEQFIVAVGGHRSIELRAVLFDRFLAQGLAPATVIHVAASVSPFASVEEGSLVLAGAVISAGARVGKNVIVNSGAIVEHDAEIGDHVQLSPGAIVTGGVVVEPMAFVGAGAVLLPFRRIGRGAIVGAGAVVTKDVAGSTTVVGNPAREVPHG